jgi:ABC-2 type transport system ATP-binding protein
MLCGLLRPTSGRATVDGIDVGRDPERVKRRIGYMSQRVLAVRAADVDQNIRFYAGLYGLTGERLARRRRSRSTSAASPAASTIGREPERWLAAAPGARLRLLHEPPILFLTKPTGGVDPVSAREFWRLIDDLSRAGTTVLVTTHYLDEASGAIAWRSCTWAARGAGDHVGAEIHVRRASRSWRCADRIQ